MLKEYTTTTSMGEGGQQWVMGTSWGEYPIFDCSCGCNEHLHNGASTHLSGCAACNRCTQGDGSLLLLTNPVSLIAVSLQSIRHW